MRRALAALAAVHLLAACSEKPAPSPSPPPSPPQGGGEGEKGGTAAALSAPPSPAQGGGEGEKGGAAPAPTPAATPAPAPAATPSPPPSPAQGGGEGEKGGAAPAPAGRAAVGADRCKACHRIQHSSWAAGGHPAKGVDCEFCHGPGSDYIPIKIMKDPAAARAAGLVIPGKDRCLPCHAAKWSDDLLAKAHAHKPK